MYATTPVQQGAAQHIVTTLKSVVSTGVIPDASARMAMVTNGALFVPEVEHLTSTVPQFSTLAAVPHSVIFESPGTCQGRVGSRTCATVVYSVVAGRKVMATNLQGLFVPSGANWQMQGASYCQVLGLVGGSCPAGVLTYVPSTTTP